MDWTEEQSRIAALTTFAAVLTTKLRLLGLMADADFNEVMTIAGNSIPHGARAVGAELIAEIKESSDELVKNSKARKPG